MAQGKVIPLEGERAHCGFNRRRLAVAVFCRALEDLKASHLNDRRTALHFLLKSERDFSFWCQQLDVDPKTFRRKLCKRVLGSCEGLSSLFTETL